LKGLSEGLHYEVRPLRIDGAIIEPGAFPTEMSQKARFASDVTHAVVDLINLPKGERPLRTVVDPTNGEFIKKANDAGHVEYAKAMTAFGLDRLLA
jgi:hypothetical protein